jgi:Rad3-related DNA helicase
MVDIDIEKYFPYPAFQPGQKECITEVLSKFEDGCRVIEIDGPTASGKSAILYTLGLILTNEYYLPRIIYTTPLVQLVNQLQDNIAFNKLATLKGKANYDCLLTYEHCDTCPYPTFGDAMKSPTRRICEKCPYQKDRAKVKNSPFAATTLARYLADPNMQLETSGLVIDESAKLEKPLLERAALELPPEVDIEDLGNSVNVYNYRLQEELSENQAKYASAYETWSLEGYPQSKGRHGKHPLLIDITKYRRIENALMSKIDRANVLLGYLAREEPYMVDNERKFRIFNAYGEFSKLTSNMNIVILASGTPATGFLTKTYAKVKIAHPINVSRRTCYEYPVGSMNYQERKATIPKMASVLDKLHHKYNKHTIVHCGAYAIAAGLYDNLGRSLRNETILQDDPKNRAGALKEWMDLDRGMFLSIEFVEGIDLKGPEYPMNIIAKIPFENFTDPFVKRRNEIDGWARYNSHAAISVMQAAGRCTRSLDDYSETYILDSTWQGTFARNKSLFQDWFKASLKRINGLEEVPHRMKNWKRKAFK